MALAHAWGVADSEIRKVAAVIRGMVPSSATRRGTFGRVAGLQMQVISFINMKGGVGKTTLAVNIAYALAAQHHKRVLLVDIDPQFNASTYLVDAPTYLKHIKDRHSVLDIFLGNKKTLVSSVTGTATPAKPGQPSLTSCAIAIHKEPKGGKLDLIPSTLDLMTLETSQRLTETRLNTFLNSKAQVYDYVLIDCPPTISFFTQAAILATDKYIVPVKPDDLSVIGLPLLERWLADYTDNAGKSVAPIGIVFCLVRNPRPNQMKKVMADLRAKRTSAVFADHLSQGASVAASVEAHQPIFVHAPTSKYAKELLGITKEFVDRTR